jgi:GDP-4-dehydro-6-deoxy-D-mannose reductase
VSTARALVIGAEGFAGTHLVRHLRDCGDQVIGTMRPLPEGRGIPFSGASELEELEITDRAAVRRVLQAARPQVIYHLAAITFVPASFADPLPTYQVNTFGALNVLEEARLLPDPPRFIFISTSEVYGRVNPREVPVAEDHPLLPANPYAASKVAMEAVLQGYRALPGAPEWVILRSFNHTGPGQSRPFVCSDFAAQVAAIAAGTQEPVIHVGNLAAVRDFTDVRDVVRAYRLAALKGRPHATYNVASGNGRSIRSVLDELAALVDVEIRIEIDHQRMRPSDMPLMIGDASLLRRDTGWRPEISWQTTLQDLLYAWQRETGG